MVCELKNKSKILTRLYEDFVLYAEEISLIEETYLWHNITVFVDDEHSIGEFLILHAPSFYWGGKSLSAYIAAIKTQTILEFANILKEKLFQTHLQTSTKASFVKEFMPWLTQTYTVRYCRVDSATFKPHCKYKRSAVRLTPQNIKQFQPQLIPI